MIKNSTVFVLGAGASMPYGFPSGRALVDEIVLRLTPTNKGPGPMHAYTSKELEEEKSKIRFDKNFFDLLNGLGYEYGHIESFVHDLRDSRAESIDAFLEQREVYMELGKAAIAYVIVSYESQESLYQENVEDEPDDWYRYVWNIMVKNVGHFEELKNNKVTFVTFNYDRSLEHYLMRGMKAWFDKREDDCKRVLNQVQIIHLHGSLGSLSWQTEGIDFVDYGQYPMYPDDLRMMAASIKIISEKMPMEQFDKANQQIRRMDQTVFLGFGYHEVNMRRLKINAIPNTFHRLKGTCYHLTSREIGRIRNIYPNKLMLSDKWLNFRSLRFLREVVDLEEKPIKRKVKISTI